MARSALRQKPIKLIGLILPLALMPTLVAGEQLSVKELLERAQTENERKAVEGLIGKLRTEPKPADNPASKSTLSGTDKGENAQKTQESQTLSRGKRPADTDKIEKINTSKAEKSNGSKGFWSIFTGWGKSQPKKPDPVQVPRTRQPSSQSVKRPASTNSNEQKSKISTANSDREKVVAKPKNAGKASPVRSQGRSTPSQDLATRSAASSLEKAVILANQNRLASADIVVEFDFDSHEISAKAGRSIRVMGKAFTDKRLASQKFLIAGHTDAKGRKSYNKDLSQKRATSIRAFLIKAFGIKEDRLIAKGFGEKHLKNQLQPRASENRRVQIINLQNSPR